MATKFSMIVLITSSTRNFTRSHAAMPAQDDGCCCRGADEELPFDPDVEHAGVEGPGNGETGEYQRHRPHQGRREDRVRRADRPFHHGAASGRHVESRREKKEGRQREDRHRERCENHPPRQAVHVA